MDRPDLPPVETSDGTESPAIEDALAPGLPGAEGEAERSWLLEIIERLEEDPDECWPAYESLAVLDEEIRAQVVEALAPYGDRPGVGDLLRLLLSFDDPDRRSAAIQEPVSPTGAAGLPAIRTGPEGHAPALDELRRSTRITRSLVTALDGDGRGTIILSAFDRGSRHTAAFQCDVRRGILDVVGEVEQEHPSAGRMIDEWISQADGVDHATDVPELAIRLLEGCWLLCSPDAPDEVRAWLDATLGSADLPAGLAATLPGPSLPPIPDRELIVWADRILDACPTWLDRSALTFELAEEIALREGCATPDPIRDAGAYRYLFEHLLIDRLELYSRMLLWMAWFWHALGRPDLSRPAFVLAAQLTDEQYAVPSHPFTVALTTRSLLGAQTDSLPGGRRDSKE